MIVNFNNKIDDNHFNLSSSSVLRRLDRDEHSLLNHLLSIAHDSEFVDKVANIYQKYALLGNLRCGKWYNKSYDGYCYFKSTEGHYGQWNFSLTRTNLSVIDFILNAPRGERGVVIVDSTRRGKKFPDSFSRTIPIWCCVINRTLYNLKIKKDLLTITTSTTTSTSTSTTTTNILNQEDWETFSHPMWLSNSEVDQMTCIVNEYSQKLLLYSHILNLESYATKLDKPIKPLFINVDTIWIDNMNESPTTFYPIYLLSASDYRDNNRPFRAYIQGAGDDEENWSNKLSAQLFWTHKQDILGQPIDNVDRYCQELVKNNSSMDKTILFVTGSQDNPTIINIPNTLISISNSKTLNSDDLFNNYGLMINCSSIEYQMPIQIEEMKQRGLKFLSIQLKEGKKSKDGLHAKLQEAESEILNTLSQDRKILIHSLSGNGDLPNCMVILLVVLAKYFKILKVEGEEGEQVFIKMNDKLQQNKNITKFDISNLYLFIDKYCPQCLPPRTIRNNINSYLMK
ncbi:Putative initiator tRNA phosphoribosyl-transferase [Cavenderia fasciculata]|uniref:Initiator tRNA phosphoribosyl-transferase n=1 Tax=Cavenderia fasciculata TaxID=261658 RepID=F4Q8M0_CACFS|nr:Putative initiator tRNA phosphoribosyl-transferase [Cavenderia fasciculata]EGG16120.1 Putative initiator tRNA phosphoribosyl-transferase [Cavenderia fasciculata]|eukprot:XP_004352453.1 Putative initiator tRNA phosphoribosyl-transferase [Cavenderia fasciculata]